MSAGPGRRFARVTAVTVALLVLGAGCAGPEPDAGPEATRSPSRSSSPSVTTATETATATATATPSPTGQGAAEDTASPRGSGGSPGPDRTREPRARPKLSAADQARLDRRLIDAAWQNDVLRARRLVRRGADVNTQDSTQQSAFLIASSEGYLELLKLTLRNGADVDAKDSFNGTALIRAAERGHWDVCGWLVQSGVELDHVNNLGWTALHEALILGDGSRRYRDTVRVLVGAGVDVTIASARDGVRPVQHAEAQGYGGMARLLRAAQRRDRRAVAQDAADRRLRRAADMGAADNAALAIRAGAALESRDSSRRTPLLLAVTSDRLAAARLLVALGADPDAVDDRQDTPWLVTGVTGSVDMANVLLRADPDLTIRNRFGGISIIPASERGHVAYVRRVVRTDIDVNHVNDLGWTALLEAVILGDGSTPYQEIVRILLDAGADPAITDSDGVSALEHARRRGQGEVTAILRRAG